MVAEVIIDLSARFADRIFDYNISDELSVSLGVRVVVPFNNKVVVGFIVGIKEQSDYKDKLKSVIKVCDDYPIISEEFFSIVEFMTSRYNLRRVDVFRLFFPQAMRLSAITDKKNEYISLDNSIELEEIKASIPTRQKNKHLAIIEVNKGDCERKYLNKTYGKSNIDQLIEKGVFKITSEIIRAKPYQSLNIEDKGVTLNDEQLAAVDSIEKTDKTTTLLKGVTGSGKTEVYLKLIENALNAGRSAILLVPEISLTPQLLSRFRGRFGDLVALQHSALSDRERYDEWQRIRTGEAKIVIGARSAVFAPSINLGLIIIDEEHDSSYISENNPRYNTLEVAQIRVCHVQGKLILGSATPSIETFKRAQDKVINLAELNSRFNNITMPKIDIVDMSLEIINGNNSIFSRELISSIASCLEKKEQVIIFLNRRGYASFLMCKKCGYIAQCEDCSISLTYHKSNDKLKCHYCSRRYRMPDRCPNCNSNDIKMGRTGTQKVVSELNKIFSDVKILRMDNDSTIKKNDTINIIEDFKNKKADILVGTQMIAKGHNFNSVTLVGILEADMSLYYADFRSSERTFQLITQVAGRAGRDKLLGRVILQTYSPKHYVFKYATEYDYLGFYMREINLREVTSFPPFTTILRLLISSSNEDEARDNTKILYDKLKDYYINALKDIQYFSAMKSPINRLEGKFRYQIMMRIYNKNIDRVLQDIYNIKEKCGFSVWVELNPQNLG